MRMGGCLVCAGGAVRECGGTCCVHGSAGEASWDAGVCVRAGVGRPTVQNGVEMIRGVDRTVPELPDGHPRGGGSG